MPTVSLHSLHAPPQASVMTQHLWHHLKCYTVRGPRELLRNSEIHQPIQKIMLQVMSFYGNNEWWVISLKNNNKIGFSQTFDFLTLKKKKKKPGKLPVVFTSSCIVLGSTPWKMNWVFSPGCDRLVSTSLQCWVEELGRGLRQSGFLPSHNQMLISKGLGEQTPSTHPLWTSCEVTLPLISHIYHPSIVHHCPFPTSLSNLMPLSVGGGELLPIPKATMVRSEGHEKATYNQS